ncbi:MULTISPECIES: carbohydrate kinase family protein [unclassified Paenibacillus]|uniref:carbohydrate kinase family protein n=1 Tax=unclassified Paenibacillus TaxID=185978 RepID=UPI002405661E|nr:MULTISPECIES: carbohydrate kinase family protein [unclassified Paenibacillus]MDF9844146.1 sugar/nucleoside kinase (ribokinase family) [Paenibacillus sp. PastF-2]MDF9850731.1 sugar/nucleoside kinase (ribokinase family) [Paenibacillus sp. PastM-2]MDH6482590.1 sugar/nucleoside kinase (ribokinase family) [Paenibacillus sp. PastH-2]MDH6510017.1 sugar/nucleoside kinase (ribokinase family) [Paenibacillus sp. PastM-3]
MTPKVTVAGAINLESVDGSPAELVGGGVYAACASAGIAKTKLIGSFGGDVSGSALFELMSQMDIDASEIFTFKSHRTFKWSIHYSSDRQEVLSETREYGDYESMIPDPAPFSTSVLLLASGHPFHHQAVLDRLMKEEETFIMLDTKAVHLLKRSADVQRILPHCHVVFLNEEELVTLMDVFHFQSADQIFGSFVKLQMIIIKQGDRGGTAILRQGKRLNYKAAIPYAGVKDYTGAGDFFAGTLAAMIANRARSSLSDIISVDTLKQSAEAAARSIGYVGAAKCVQLLNSKKGVCYEKIEN